MLSLLELWRRRDEVAWGLVIVLLMLIYVLTLKLRVLNAQLAARPAIHQESQQKVQIVRVAGPTRVETRTVYKPGTTEIQYVDRIVDRAPVTTTENKEASAEQDVKPALPIAAPAPWREVSLLVDPFAPSKLVGVDASATIFGRLVVGVGGRIDRGGEGHARVGVRF